MNERFPGGQKTKVKHFMKLPVYEMKDVTVTKC